MGSLGSTPWNTQASTHLSTSLYTDILLVVCRAGVQQEGRQVRDPHPYFYLHQLLARYHHKSLPQAADFFEQC